MALAEFIDLFDFITSPLMAVYFISAVFGGIFVVLQLLLMLIGFGGDDGGGDFSDADDRAFPTELSKILTFRTINAGITFFGLGGLAGLTYGTTQWGSVIIAIISGCVAVYTVFYMYFLIDRMKTDGTLSQKTLVGCTGNVYIRIPPGKAGMGKVLVSQQGRTAEYDAITAGETELKTNTPIVVIGVISTTVVEVVPIT